MQITITPEDLYKYVMSAKDIHESDYGPAERSAMRSNYGEFMKIAEAIPDVRAAVMDAAVGRLIQIGLSAARNKAGSDASVSEHT